MTRVVEELRARLSSSDPEERRRATSDLGHSDLEVVAGLVLQALADEDWRVRKEAVHVALAAAPNRLLLDGLVNALSAPENVGLRNAAVEAIGGYGEEAVDTIARALPHLDADGRKLAVEALGRSCRASALPVLSSLLDDTDPNVRVAAVEAITAIGSAGAGDVSTLLEASLSAREPLTALAALEGLNTLGVVLPWATIARCLEDPTRRRPALLAAGRSGDARAVPVLIDALAAARSNTLLEVTLAIRELAREPDARAALIASRPRIDPGVGVKLVQLAQDGQESSENRRAALLVLGLLSLAGAAECALAALSDDRLISEAHEALELLGARAVPALVAAAQSSGDEVSRASCLNLIATLADDQQSALALTAARRALADEFHEVQRAGLGLLSRRGDASSLRDIAHFLVESAGGYTAKAAEVALRELCAQYPDAAREVFEGARPDHSGAHPACIAFGAVRERASGSLEAGVRFLCAALSNTSAPVRRAALEVLADVGGSEGVDAVAFALTDEEREVRLMAVEALGRMRDKDGASVGARQLVELAAVATEAELLAAAVRALGETGDAHAVPVLKRLIRSPQPFVAVSAVEALARVAGPRRVDAVIEGLGHSDAEVVKATMLALSDAPDPRVIAHWGACLDHEAWDVRRLAADLLGRMSGELALEFLRARFPSEESPPVQQAISRALERAAGVRRTPVPAPLGSLRPR